MFFLIMLNLLCDFHLNQANQHSRLRRELFACESVPQTFAKRWQLIGQKGRQLWIGQHYFRIIGPVDDVFGKAAGGKKVHWYNIKCDDYTVQMKAVLSESRAHDTGEYMCLRLRKEEDIVIGIVVRESTKLTNKYGLDCEFWSDGRKRRAYKFHLTDKPSWVDLLNKNDAVTKASGNVTMKVCKKIPEGFHGEWKLVGSDKVVEIRSEYYRAYGASGTDPFWRTNEELEFYSLICNPRRIVLRLYMWELPSGSRSQLQCLVLARDGEYDISGHAVNVVASQSSTQETPEIDCDHGIGNGYTRYPLHLSRHVGKHPAPYPSKQIHPVQHAHLSLPEKPGHPERANEQPHPVTPDNPHHTGHEVDSSNRSVTHEDEFTDVEEVSPQEPNQHIATIHKTATAVDNHPPPSHFPEPLPSYAVGPRPVQPSHMVQGVTPPVIPEYMAGSQQHLPIYPPYMPSPGTLYRGPQWTRPSLPQLYSHQFRNQGYMPSYYTPYWMKKRTLLENNTDSLKRKFVDYGDYEDASPSDNISKVLAAINKQNLLIEDGFAKINAYINKDSVSTTEDWDYIKPYLKQEVAENVAKKELAYAYYDDDK